MAAAHSHVVFAFHVGPCSPSPDSSDTSTPKLRAHLSPVSLETRITSQQFRPPSSQEKAVFRQTFAKITLYKLKYNLYLYLQKSIYVPVISYYFRETFAKQIIYFSKFRFLLSPKVILAYQRPGILHSRQGPLDRHPYILIPFRRPSLILEHNNSGLLLHDELIGVPRPSTWPT